MTNPLPYIIYFLGPFAVAIVVRWSLDVSWRPLGAGFLVFLFAWIAVMVATQIPAALSPRFAEGTVLYSLLVAASAGVFEESARYIAFRRIRSLRKASTWRTGIMYAVGHSGMESFIVGASLVLTAAVVAYAPEALSPELLTANEELLATGTIAASYGAMERLLIGLLIHAAFTLVVVLAIVRSDRRYLAVAIGWHMAHDVIAQNLHRVSEGWIAHAAWIGLIVAAYSWLLLGSIQTLRTSQREGGPIG